MVNLGERIKKLRKEKKLTQTGLAGNRLTKGMLSLIENGKAQPSMESLRFLAKQLDVEVSVLLDDGTLAQLRGLYTDIEADLEKRELILDAEEKQSLTVSMIEKIEPFLAQIQGNNYEQIRLREVYFLMNRTINKAKSLDEYWHFIEQYEAVHAYSRMLRCYFYISYSSMEQRNYQETLVILKQGEQRIEPFELLIDPMVRLDLYYNLTISYAAVDEADMSEHYLQKALDIVKRKKVYFRMDNFYQLVFIQSIANENMEKSTECLHKINLLAEFSEDPNIAVDAAFSNLHYMNNVEKNYAKIDEQMLKYHATLKEAHFLDENPLFKCEQMYAHFMLGNMETALNYGEALEIPTYVYHPIDLAIYYRFFAIRALAYHYKGDHEVAKREIIYAKNGIEDFHNSIYKKFVLEAYYKIFFE